VFFFTQLRGMYWRLGNLFNEKLVQQTFDSYVLSCEASMANKAQKK